MAVFNYIFIFLLLSFGLIESKNDNSGTSKEEKSGTTDALIQTEERKHAAWFSSPEEYSPISNRSKLAIEEVVINEIMADPTPVAGLPDREYLELFNSGATAVNLKNWILELGNKQKNLPDILLPPDGYLLVAAPGGSKDLQTYGKVVEISGFLLNNSGATISLYDPLKRLTDQVAYAPSMHAKGFGEGGYSLERIDPFRMCGQGSNWTTSISARGGTPGAENSVRASNPDRVPPQIISTTFAEQSRLEVQLSERVMLPAVKSELLQNITPGVVVDSIQLDQDALLLKIWFRPGSILNGTTHSMVIHGLKDECSNLLPDHKVKFGYFLPVKADLLINEVLFNPYPDGFDFVEIYNNSPHEVDLSGLYLATRDNTQTIKQVSQLAVSQQYLPVGAYLAVTKSREGILRFYQSDCEDCILATEKFPTLNDDAGYVILMNQSQEIIDEMNYDEGMHHPFITEKEGISLERISLTVPASIKENWQSAAQSTGFATPGYKNSVAQLPDTTDQMATIEPVLFSPNGDGINDELKISLRSENSGWILNITILNYAGRPVRNLANNFTTGSSDILRWDGLGDDFQKVQPGIYILNISLFSLQGKRKTTRLVCVVSDRL